MIKIGIIDDESAAREELRGAITRFESENGTEFELHEFDSAAAYLSSEPGTLNILYLDIDMPQMSGMELAKRIRETDRNVILIFCTNLEQFAIDGYSVSALGFLVKPVQWYSFCMYLKRALQTIHNRSRLIEDAGARNIVVKDGSVSRVIDALDIKYVEVQQHYLLYHVTDKASCKTTVIKTRGSMQSVSEQLSRYGFYRCNVSFLVNLRSVTAISRMNVYLGEETLSMGRAYRDSFTYEFSRFLAKKEWENPCS